MMYKTIQDFQVLVLGAKHQLYKQVLVSVAEVKGTKHPAETDLFAYMALNIQIWKSWKCVITLKLALDWK